MKKRILNFLFQVVAGNGAPEGVGEYDQLHQEHFDAQRIGRCRWLRQRHGAYAAFHAQPISALSAADRKLAGGYGDGRACRSACAPDGSAAGGHLLQAEEAVTLLSVLPLIYSHFENKTFNKAMKRHRNGG